MWLVALSLAACRHNAHTDPSSLRADASAASLETGGIGSSAAALPPEVRAALEANFARVHFATDSALLDAEARSALAANAEILLDHRDVRVEVQGHADERGTIDYNLALAERRARAVERALTSMGVSEGQLGVVSFGEERPLRTGESPSAFSVNRRAEFRVTRDADGMVDGSLDQPVPAHGLISPEDEL